MGIEFLGWVVAGLVAIELSRLIHRYLPEDVRRKIRQYVWTVWQRAKMRRAEREADKLIRALRHVKVVEAMAEDETARKFNSAVAAVDKELRRLGERVGREPDYEYRPYREEADCPCGGYAAGRRDERAEMDAYAEDMAVQMEIDRRRGK